MFIAAVFYFYLPFVLSVPCKELFDAEHEPAASLLRQINLTERFSMKQNLLCTMTAAVVAFRQYQCRC